MHNVLLQDLCSIDLSEHVLIGTTDRIAFHEVANALDPAHATPTDLRLGLLSLPAVPPCVVHHVRGGAARNRSPR